MNLNGAIKSSEATETVPKQGGNEVTGSVSSIAPSLTTAHAAELCSPAKEAVSEYITQQFISHPVEPQQRGKRRRTRPSGTDDKVKTFQDKQLCFLITRRGPAAAGMWMDSKAEVEWASRTRASFSRRVSNALLLFTGDMEYLDKFMEGKNTHYTFKQPDSLCFYSRWAHKGRSN